MQWDMIIEGAINEIECRLPESLTISELASKAHLSPPELQQGFK